MKFLTKKRVNAVVGVAFCSVVAATSLLAGGCGQGNGDPVEEGATHVKIMMREFEGWRNKHFSSLVTKFNSNLEDGLQVDVEYVIEENFNDRLQSAREAGAAPDIILHSYNHIYTQAIDNGTLSPLNGLMSDAALNDIVEGVKPAIEFNDQVYAYPWYTEASTVLFYSKSKFQQAGITKAPTTWNEMLDACEKIKPLMPKGTYALGMPLGGDIGWATWGMVYNQLGGWPIADDWSKSVFDGNNDKVADFSRLLNYYSKLYDNAYTPISALHANGYNEIITAWADGKYAMTLAVSSQLGTILQEFPEMLDDLGMAVMPTETGDADAVTATNGGWCFCIDAKSKNKEAAAQVIEALMYTDTDTNAEFYELSGYSRYPALKSVMAKTDVASANSPYKEYADLISNVCSNAVMEPIYTWNISLQIAWAFDNMIQGYDALDGVTDEAKRISTLQRLTLEVRDNINQVISAQNLSGKNPAMKG